MATLLTDLFQRASTTSPGVADTGQTWVARIGTWAADHYLYSATANDGDQVTVDLGAGKTNQHITVRTTVGAATASAFPQCMARWESTSKFYLCGINPDGTVGITRWAPYGSLARTGPGVIKDEDLLTFWVREESGATALTAYVNGTQVLSVTDSNASRPLTGTSIGFRHGAATPGLGISWDELTVTDGAAPPPPAVTYDSTVLLDGEWTDVVSRHRIGGAWVPAP